MSLFKESINDIIKDIKNEKFEDAQRILDDHIENEHHLDSDLAKLQQTVGFYQRHLVDCKRTLIHLIHDPEPKQHDIDVVVKNLENAQMEVGLIEELIRKLVKEGKLAE
jgi:hypothetical protein